MSSPRPRPARPLGGVRVLDASEGVPGAYCTKLLADQGADVIKVERPDGDPLRRWSASSSCGRDGERDGALFRYLHAGKEIATLDPALPDGAKQLRRLCAGADIVVDGRLHGVSTRRLLDWPALRVANDAAVLVTITPFGVGGPRSDQDASEFLLQAWCGSIFGHGDPAADPLAMGGRLGEWIGGAFAALGAATALWRSRRRGSGEWVDVSLLEGMTVSLLAYPSVTASFTRGPRRRHPNVLIPGIEACRDGYAGLFVLTAQQWGDFTAMIGHPDLGSDPDLVHMLNRFERRQELVGLITGWTRERTVQEVLETAALFRVPAAPVGNGATVAAMDHLVERGVFGPGPGAFRQPRPPLRFSPGSSDTSHRPERPRPRRSDWRRRPRPNPREELDPDPGERPLTAIRVLDLTAFWAGPFATQYLAAMGADVIKVESVQRPDPSRFNVVGGADTQRWYERAPLFHAANLGKRGITLNLQDPRGRELLLAIVRNCDLVMENFTPRVMDHLGLDYAILANANPMVSLVRMPAFGLDGPWRDRPGFGPSIEQISGMSWISGYADGPPMSPGGFCDPLAGVHAALAAVLALEMRRTTGHGSEVEVPMVEAGLNITAEQVIEHDAYGVILSRCGNRDPVLAPQGVYRCSGPDEWVALSVRTDAEWSSLAALVDPSDLGQDLSLSTATGRQAEHDRIDRAITAWAQQRTRAEAAGALSSAGVPNAPVMPNFSINEDPQMRCRGFFETVSHPVVGVHEYPGWPLRMSEGPGSWYRSAAPTLGQHTEEVLSGLLGIEDEELTSLRRDLVIGDEPFGL